MKTFGIAFIGAGDISLLHAQAIEQCDNARLIGLWNITPELAAEKSRIFKCENYPSVEILLKDDRIDAVFILTILEAHYSYASMALKAGKHVFVEKPVATTIMELNQLMTIAKQVGKVCMPGHNYIYDPAVIRVKRLLDSGNLGKLVALYVLYNIHHPEEVAARYPGVIRQIMTHHAYISIYLAGTPQWVSAMKSVLHYEQIKQEDLAMSIMKMKNGSLVHLCASFAADDHAGDPWTMMVKIIGTKGAARYSYRDWVENTAGVVHSQTYSAYPFSILQIDQYFIEKCLQRDQSPLSTLEDAILAQKIIEAMERSEREGRHVAVE